MDKEISITNVPEHIAIIMDGNGRWAKNRGMVRVAGHNAGMKSLKEIVRACSDLGVKYLTVYAFSTENWKRPGDEVDGIFKIMVKYIAKELKELHKENVRLRAIGDWEKIPKDACESMKYAMDLTHENTGLIFNIALNYGGRREIVEAARKLYADMEKNGSDVDDINEETLAKYMSTSDMPDPDIIIRTGGEMRLSNFLLWQCAYSEFIFTDVYWPDFTKEELVKCIEEFNSRHRRYGGL
jgi:undecaprenyl diphosphate synthase